MGNELRGTVRDELGQPIANFSLAARFKPKVKGAKWEDRDLGDFAGGTFAVNNLQVGRWKLLPVCEGYSAGKSKVIKLPYDGDPIAIVLDRRAVLTGQVLDPNGEGVSNASVHLRDRSMGDGVITQGDGTFRMTLKPGPFGCLAKSEVYSASEEVEGTIGLGEVQEVTLHLGLGARLEGRVKDFEGNVGVDWVVDLRNSQFHLDRRTVRTNEQGEFVIEHAAPGTYWVTAQGTSSTVSGSRPLRETVELIEGQTTRLDLGGINETSIRVTGTVYRDGAPEPKASVWANMEGAKAFSSSMMTQADESGRFEVHFPEAGPVNFLVATEPNQLVPIPFLLEEAREQEIDIHVPSGQISGRVTQPGGGKFKRRMVKCSPEGRNPIHSLYLTRTTRCESDGSFSFGHLPAGTYRVQVASVIDPKSVAEDVVLIEDGHVKGLELQIRGTGRATVKVMDPDGKPVDGAFVFIQDAQGNAHAAGSTRKTNGAGELKLS
ncbi:MAG: carboxypeptidase-like regulatory domain-containing protein, partial [Planctomycetota bacterium]|nr:carboxypeptidase-like regulatory domain-containing protein [Planctomycetota bacterium]